MNFSHRIFITLHLSQLASRVIHFFVSLNALQWTMIGLAMIFVLWLPFSRRIATTYLRLLLLAIAATLILMPFVWLICAAFKDKDVLNEYAFLPPIQKWNSSTINLDNFRTLLADKASVQGNVNFVRYIFNSLFLASSITFIGMVFSSMGGYALAKYRFHGRGPILVFMLASLTIPGVVMLAPNFEVIYRLGWMDTYQALIVPAAVSVFGIFLYRQAIIGVPTDLIEAGRIDGCGEFRIYLTLIMPLVRPMTGAFCLVTFLGAWNAFLGPNIFLQTQSKLPLPVVLNQYIGEYSQHYGVFLAGTLLAIIPPAVLFFSLQKEFISGLASGAVKG